MQVKYILQRIAAGRQCPHCRFSSPVLAQRLQALAADPLHQSTSACFHGAATATAHCQRQVLGTAHAAAAQVVPQPAGHSFQACTCSVQGLQERLQELAAGVEKLRAAAQEGVVLREAQSKVCGSPFAEHRGSVSPFSLMIVPRLAGLLTWHQ